MEVVHERCCGLDVHKEKVVACLITPGEKGQAQKQTRTFGTMTEELLALCEWLKANGCTHVAMESTGVYWKPVYNILEGSVEILLVNAQHIKAIPGRKTDVRDAEWIADLLRHGLLRGSFIPPRPVRELRDLTRYREALVKERVREIQRLQKILEDTNIKLSVVVTDITGVSARAILEALVEGSSDPKVMAELAKGRLRSKIWELERALKGVLRSHHRLIIAQQLAHIDFLDEAIEKINIEIKERMRPFEEEARRLTTIHGVKERAAEKIIAEIGVNTEHFPTAAHLASWAGVCPGNNESAGKRKSGKTRKGNIYLRSALIEAARAAARTRNSYFNAQYHRLVARRGKNKAIVAVAHSLLVVIYHILKDGTVYNDLGIDHFDRTNSQRLKNRLIKRLESLGYKVTVEENAAA
uniref:IS110 family transposase n=1 Tax=Ammonifex degensii TaxID=42838 RepID=A0A7C2IQ11_9THEO